MSKIYRVRLDRYRHNSGQQFVGELQDIWAKLVNAASEHSSVFFDVALDDHVVFHGGSVGRNFALFTFDGAYGANHFVHTFSRTGGDQTLIELVDRRWELIYFVPRLAFGDSGSIYSIALEVLAGRLKPRGSTCQSFSAIGFPNGLNGGNELISELLASDLSGDKLHPGRWELGITRVLNRLAGPAMAPE